MMVFGSYDNVVLGLKIKQLKSATIAVMSVTARAAAGRELIVNQKKAPKLVRRCGDCAEITLNLFNDGTGRYICANCKYGGRIGDLYININVLPTGSKKPTLDDYDSVGGLQ